MSFYVVREEHPLQQGLRLAVNSGFAGRLVVREEHPLQQGLRPCLSQAKYPSIPLVREEHPLQQGLRPIFFIF